MTFVAETKINIGEQFLSHVSRVRESDFDHGMSSLSRS